MDGAEPWAVNAQAVLGAVAALIVSLGTAIATVFAARAGSKKKKEEDREDKEGLRSLARGVGTPKGIDPAVLNHLGGVMVGHTVAEQFIKAIGDLSAAAERLSDSIGDRAGMDALHQVVNRLGDVVELLTIAVQKNLDKQEERERQEERDEIRGLREEVRRARESRDR